MTKNPPTEKTAKTTSRKKTGKTGETPEYRLAARIVAHIGLSDPALGLSAVAAKAFICDTLTREPDAAALLRHDLYPNAQPVEEAAESYFAAVFERPISPVRGEPATKAHELLTVRLARMSGQRAWRDMALTEKPVPDAVLLFDPALRLLARRLRALTGERGPGPGLQSGDLTLTLPKQLTLWEAVALPPAAFLPPDNTGDRVTFLFVLTAAFENAARHWKELLAAGLVPPGHWLEGTTVNQLRKLNAFRREIEGGASAEDAWATVGGVPKFDGPRQVMDSDLWRRSLHQGWRVGEFGADDPERTASGFIPTEDGQESAAMNTTPDDRLLDMLEALRLDGVIDDLDAKLFAALVQGRTLRELAGNAPFKERIAAINVSVDDYAKELCNRVTAHLAARAGGENEIEEDGHDDR